MSSGGVRPARSASRGRYGLLGYIFFLITSFHFNSHVKLIIILIYIYIYKLIIQTFQLFQIKITVGTMYIAGFHGIPWVIQ